MAGQRRVVAWCGRLLLFTALLLGIVTMHTLGHPSSGGHGGGARAGAEAGAGRHTAAGLAGDHAGGFAAVASAGAAAHPAVPVSAFPAVPPAAPGGPAGPGGHSAVPAERAAAPGAHPAVPGDHSRRTADAAARVAGPTVGSAKLSAEDRGPGRSAGTGEARVAEEAARPHGGAHATDPVHHTGMDPMSVCLAVLGAALLTLVLLLTAAALRRRAAARPATARARLRALWPIPPPPRHKSLARLSVLRV
ncbi:hypothetical protein M1P56_06100 [Streptomyces sp. HU2014]|uniref:hypothetical protein n=1 Tax=Streptomyces sp. HU2014 TaxID=2939414 RepID=UPI00200EE156|nr:hypothetical protein [Streptomyces sp. HU2014]UQI43951.1 hypothetical protein M1P56_06100 [Streptomyces sp. HU2014]